MMNAPRDPRSEAPHLGMDLTRDTSAIHGDLRERWPRMAGLWWELDPDETSGCGFGTRDAAVAAAEHAQRERKP